MRLSGKIENFSGLSHFVVPSIMATGFGRNFKHAGVKKLTSEHWSSSRNRFILSIFSGPIICWKDKIFLHIVGALECRLTFQKH